MLAKSGTPVNISYNMQKLIQNLNDAGQFSHTGVIPASAHGGTAFQNPDMTSFRALTFLKFEGYLTTSTCNKRHLYHEQMVENIKISDDELVQVSTSPID